MLKILVVDDNEEIRQLLSNALTGNYTVYTAGTTEVAKHILSTRHIDMVFLDVWMSGIDSTELIPWMKNRGLECITVIITGDTVNDYSNIDGVVHRVLIKPFRLKDIVIIAARALELKLEKFTKEHLKKAE